jgi:hypothetical protein
MNQFLSDILEDLDMNECELRVGFSNLKGCNDYRKCLRELLKPRSGGINLPCLRHFNSSSS